MAHRTLQSSVPLLLRRACRARKRSGVQRNSGRQQSSRTLKLLRPCHVAPADELPAGLRGLALRGLRRALATVVVQYRKLQYEQSAAVQRRGGKPLAITSRHTFHALQAMYGPLVPYGGAPKLSGNLARYNRVILVLRKSSESAQMAPCALWSWLPLWSHLGSSRT
jgi:hypothetical protein